ncbi:C2H2-type domain-containing protein [Mycena venus]|uniref:C2H2-type domain-containing protein n=1 Tax=Mycena venus TaxID=2733690 RepID=A0A8H6XSQ6_9AGAR|nr:C2H2-type domain-containing protein [Mycena venus]
MQSPLLHQLSSVRDSLMRDDPQSPMNYHNLPSSMHSPSLGLRPRAPHSTLPLSSLASSNSGGNLLASTILDLSTSIASSNSPSSDQAPASAQPLSKSEQDLAHYLATSNPTHSQSLNREPTLHTSFSGEWHGSSHSLSGMFDRSGSSGSGGLMSMSWDDMTAAANSSSIEPNPSSSEPNPNPNSVSNAASSSSSPPQTLRLYNPRGEYLASSVHGGDPSTWAASPSRPDSDSASASATRPGSDPIHTPYHLPTPPIAPLSLPLPPSLVPRVNVNVNVNTGPRAPIQPQLDSPHLRATAFFSGGAGVSPSALSASPRPYSPHPPVARSQASSPFPELAYPDDAEVPERYVNLADLTAAPIYAAATAGTKRHSDVAEEAEGSAKRLCLRDRADGKPSGGSANSPASNSGNDGAGEAEEEGESEEDVSQDEDDSENDSEEDFDADDSGDNHRSRSRRAVRSSKVKHEEDGSFSVSAKHGKRKEGGTGKRPQGRRRHTGSAAQALRVVTELARGKSASVSVSATGAATEDGMQLIKMETEVEAGYFASAHEKLSPTMTMALPSPVSVSATSTPRTLAPPPLPSPPPRPPLRTTSTRPTPLPPPPVPATPAYGLLYDGTGLGMAPRKNSAIPLPVPVPNLIKKSRGRRVPATVPGALGNGGTPGAGGTVEGERTFVCSVAGCGKCFVRGEHLKRHVRSIHTYEKPYRCPSEGCGKAFSRRDNLAQHSRIHLPA